MPRTSPNAEFGQREFRNSLGTFATGVTIITTCTGDGAAIGITANSFASVSLDPPLVLWSIDRNSSVFEVMSSTEHFAVHVLHSEQQELSNLFAKSVDYKFEQTDWQRGIGNIPVLNDYYSRFQCKTQYAYEGGDHLILVGQVLDFHTKNQNLKPLVFYKGQYRGLECNIE